MQETSKDKSKAANKFVNNFKYTNKKQASKSYNKKYNKKVNYKKNHNRLYHLKISISRIYDSALPIRNFFNKIISAIIKKGNHERSILIFYNNEEKGLSLPINNFMILFFILIFASLIYTGFDAYYKQKEARDFYNTLSATEAKTYSLITEYKDSLNRYSKSLKEYNDTIKNISYLIDYNNNSSFNNNNNDNDINKILNEVDRYQKNILTFMDVSSVIHKEIPVGWPVAGGGRISSGFGARLSPFTQERSYHYGVDIAGPYGTPILAAADGKVTFAGWKNGYGWFVLIEHANGYQTGYGHNSELLVHSGQEVKRGQKIAMIGNTGRTTGIHCHFEVRIAGDHKNPMPYLNARF